MRPAPVRLSVGMSRERGGSPASDSRYRGLSKLYGLGYGDPLVEYDEKSDELGGIDLLLAGANYYSRSDYLRDIPC